MYLKLETVIKTVPKKQDGFLSLYFTCTILEESDYAFKFSCKQYNPWFARLTLIFIYLPSLNVLAALYGPRTAGILSMLWGHIIPIVGGIMIGIDDSTWVMATFLILLGGAMIFLGLEMAFTLVVPIISPQDQGENKQSLRERITSLLSSLILPGLFFPFLLPFSPFIFIFIKAIEIIKPNNRLIKAQSTLGGRGESILEAAPQFALQCYVILVTLKPPDWTKWLAISTSALCLSFKNIENYVTARLEEKKQKKKKQEFIGTFEFRIQYSKAPQELKFTPKEKFLVNVSTDTFEELFTRNSIEVTSRRAPDSMELALFELKSNNETFGPMSILKNIAVFFHATLFRILVFSIHGVFFKGGGMFIILGYYFVLLFCLLITARRYNLREEKDWIRQLLEPSLSVLTITNLGRGKAAALFRLVSTLYLVIVYTITLTVILVICNTDPSNVDVLVVKWTNLPLVQDLTTLNILLVSTICLGWLSLLLDVITAAVRYYYRSRDTEEEVSFWDGAILMEGIKF